MNSAEFYIYMHKNPSKNLIYSIKILYIKLYKICPGIDQDPILILFFISVEWKYRWGVAKW